MFSMSDFKVKANNLQKVKSKYL